MDRLTFDIHRGGKIETGLRTPLNDRDDLSRAYTPGVADVCLAIAEDPALGYEYTQKSSTVAIVTDGTAVLGLGDIGPLAALPVMEGKAMLFKHFGGVNAVPICLDTTDVGEIVETVARLAPAYGGVNLEDISAPRCFEIEDLLRERLDIPVFHDDQHGTAIVALAALRNAALVVEKDLASLRVVVVGAGAAGTAVTRILLGAGIPDIVVADSKGVLDEDTRHDMSGVKADLAHDTNPRHVHDDVVGALRGADVLIGVSGPHSIPDEAIETMADGAIVFALANPVPEVDPARALKTAAVVATGRSDLPNQINNVLAFPGVFRGALDVRASTVNEAMKLAAADAIAACVPEPAPDLVIPSVFHPEVASSVAAAVAQAARDTGVARA
ncbi:MAG TPA: malic enzyme-like NAD(P)-binding protein [Frankiaceae bacterium]|nr:malic enzyme-like NAD(P)-binding protein [Frankiaceae bacterium]